MGVETLTYKSEEERQTALAGLPDAVPQERRGDIEVWQRETDQQRDAIMSATIATAASEPPVQPTQTLPSQVAPDYKPAVQPSPAASPTPTAAPAPVVTPEAPPSASAPQEPPPAPVTFNDEETIFSTPDGTEVKRKDLPEELRQYKSASEIIKQFGHARKYANQTEDRLLKMTEENVKLKENSAKVPELEQQLGALKEQHKTVSVQAEQAASIQTPEQRANTRSRLAALGQEIAGLKNISSDDLTDSEKVASFFSTAAKIGDGLGFIGDTIDTMQSTIDTQGQQLSEIGSNVTKVTSQSEQEQQKAMQQQEQLAAIRQIEKLQGDQPELSTSKPVFAPRGETEQTVEMDVDKFAQRILMTPGNPFNQTGAPSRDWNELNRVVNAYNRRDPGLVAFMTANGITPADVGTSDQDLLAYATLLNVDMMTRGEKFNEYTGVREPLLSDIDHKPVNFPNHRAAYAYMASSSGLSDRMREQQLLTARTKGQDEVAEAIERGERQPELIGKDGAVSGQEAGTVMSTQDANRMLESIDLVDMEQRALRGDRSVFKIYVQAQEALKAANVDIEVAKPEIHWPSENTAQ